MGAVEALYIFDESNNPILEHIYTARPPSAAVLLPLYLAHTAPRPSLLYLPNTNPPVLVFSIVQDRLLFLAPTSVDTEPLLVLEFLHRIADALEDFLGAPLLATKFENSYDVVVQIVAEMCDAGMVCNTEPNALREVVEAPTFIGSLLGGFGLPASSPNITNRPSSSGLSIARPQSPYSMVSTATPTSYAGSAIPWRRANVRHTSNELYVDIVETLSVVLAPSGRPLSAFANGTIAFTAKISGIPDLVLTLTAPGGKNGITHAMDLPCFHPCVRLARWRDKPGELSFVPPDGRFVLAGYECNLLPDLFSSQGKITTPKLNLPATVEIRPSLGVNGDEFEVRLVVLPKNFTGSTSSDPSSGVGSRTAGGTGRFGAPTGFNAGSSNGTSNAPTLDEAVVTIPVSASVRNVSDLKCSRGEAHHLPSEGVIEWRVSGREAASIGSAGATLRCTLVGPLEVDSGSDANGISLQTDAFDYDDGVSTSTASRQTSTETGKPQQQQQQQQQQQRTRRASSWLMPRSASLSFSVRGWLASGIKVESLQLNSKASKGLGAGVTPYKGVKYHTVSRKGIEVRG